MTTSLDPSTINPLSPNGFMLNISKLPDVTYYCQQANLPTITLQGIDQYTPLSNVAVPGEMLTYDTFDVQFLIDQEMKNYKEIHNWIIALGFPEKWTQYSSFIQAQPNGSELTKNYSDGTLSILSATNQVVQQVLFVDMFPTALESLTFQSTSSDVNYIVGQVTFRYSYYKFI